MQNAKDPIVMGLRDCHNGSRIFRIFDHNKTTGSAELTNMGATIENDVEAKNFTGR